MTTMDDPLFVLGPRTKPAQFGALAHVVTTEEEVRGAFARHRRARWVADASNLGLFAAAGEVHDTWHRVFVVGPLSNARREMLHALFRVVVTADEGVHLLSTNELEEVFATENPEDYFIGGVVDREDGVLVLFRGNLDRLLVPLSWFAAKPSGPELDLADFEVTDTGQTLRFGRYEAAADAVLYEFDSIARRRMKDKAREQDRSFGGALRRLRLQRGLSRSDFPGIDPKTVARIERGEVEKPRDDTLAILAKRMRVKPKDIETY